MHAATLGIGLVFSALYSVSADAAPATALAVVTAIDVSASVGADGFILQRNGIAHAFEDSRLVAAIAASPGGIEVLLLEWSDPEAATIAVGWHRIVDARSAQRFAIAVRAAERASAGRTAIGPALLAAASQFARLAEPPVRRVIDISGNGMANFGLPPAVARDRIVANGITINGLVLPAGEPSLASYYRDNVIGGAGAFVLEVRDEAGFDEAMLRKLVREVAGGGNTAEVSRKWDNGRRLAACLSQFAGGQRRC